MTDNKIDKIQEDITEIKVDMAKISVTLEKNTDSLELHMKRTEASERRLNILEGVWYTLCAGGAVILGLHMMGILQRLF